MWTWLAERAGYPGDGELTVAAFLALLAAFPTTIIYKLVVDADAEPFPAGRFLPSTLAGSPLGAEPSGWVVSAGALQILSVIPAVASHALGVAAPWWLTYFSLSLTALGWALSSGLSAEVFVVGVPAVGAALLLIYLCIQITKATSKLPDFGETPALATTGYGALKLVYNIVRDFLPATSPNACQVTAGILSPLPSLFAFLTMKSFTAAAEVVIPFFLIVDTLAYVVAGGAAIVGNALPPGGLA